MPRAGKSSLADAIVERHPGFTHIPLDRYIRPVPQRSSFLDWVATADCIAWSHLLDHIAILESGRTCYTPRPDWTDGRGEWISSGGALPNAPGRRMEPATTGYLIPGTHAFVFPESAGSAVRVFVDTPEHIIAERLSGKPARGPQVATIIHEWLGENSRTILDQASAADLVIDGTVEREIQVRQFVERFRSFFPVSDIEGSRNSARGLAF